MDTQRRVEWFVGLGRGMLARLKHRSWKWWLVTVGIVLVAQEIALSFIPSVTFSIARSAWTAVVWWGGRPMWVGGTALLIWCFLLFTLAWIQMSPWVDAFVKRKAAGRQEEHKLEKSLPLSAHDKDAIARLRTCWTQRKGFTATQALLYMCDYVMENLNTYYVKYHNTKKTKLEDAANRLSTALDVNKAVPLSDVIEVFNAFYAGYLDVASLLYETHRNDDVCLFETKPLRTYWAFREVHAAFAKDLEEATAFPGVAGKLKVFPSREAEIISGTPPWRRFVGDHDWEGKQPPEIKPSTSDTEAPRSPESGA